VLSIAEAATDPHLAARATLRSFAGVTQAAPAPRFSRTPSGQLSAPPTPGADIDAVRRDWSDEAGRPPARPRMSSWT
jgi:alpha-methylacyl-CoA racemase